MSAEQTYGPLAVPDVKGAVDVMKQFQSLKRDLLNETEDIVTIAGKKHVKRSGWRKIALAFNISTSIVSVEHEKTDDRYIVRVRARATAPNGRFAEEIAVCDSSEFEKGRLEATLHNIETKAATRAINRAVSDLVGGGEVSAEEAQQGEQKVPQQGAHPQPKDRTGMMKFTWKVKDADAPMAVDSGPYGFLRGKMLQGLVEKHGTMVEEDRVGDGHVTAIHLGGLPLDAQKDVVGAITWALTKLNECPKTDVRVFVDGKEWTG
jgi:hypothetical protein